tara:strand:+ start:664 stop:1857 length:1194 start_codon:yes stop_codon:yes gene_type:complete
MNNNNKIFNMSLEKIAMNFFKKIKFGNLKVHFPSGKIKQFIGSEKGVDADIKLNNFALVGKILKKGSVGFAESYMDEDFSSSDLKNLLFFARQNENYYVSFKHGKWLNKILKKINYYFNQNTKSQSRKNISYHYDLGNKFYKLWLDNSMNYSSGFFALPNEDLAKAQLNKYAKIIEPFQLNDNSTLLEIGCGWGGFSSYVAKNFGSKVNAITNSKEQYEYTSSIISKEGLNEKVKVEFKDYRDISGKYDNISSIEMFEAVGKKYWQVYFDKIKNSLNNNGLATFQIITINEKNRETYQKNPDFIQQYIFPGGMLPSKGQIYNITNSLGLNLNEFNSFGNSYANTLSIWNKQFQKTWHLIAEQGYSVRFKRMWEYYLSYCEVGFITKSTDVSHFLLKF